MDKRADGLKQLQVFGTPSAYFQCNCVQCLSLKSLLVSIKNQLCRIKCVWRERKMGMKHFSNAFIFELIVLISMPGIWYYKTIFVMFYSFSVLNAQLASNMCCASDAQQSRPTLAGLIKHAALQSHKLLWEAAVAMWWVKGQVTSMEGISFVQPLSLPKSFQPMIQNWVLLQSFKILIGTQDILLWHTEIAKPRASLIIIVT